MDAHSLWERFRRDLVVCEEAGLVLDTSRVDFPDDFREKMAPAIARAFEAMDALEKGAIANPDEGRRVGHYWLRAPDLAPDPALGAAIRQNLEHILAFAADIHLGKIVPEKGGRFHDAIIIGIGGSALGPQLAATALGSLHDKVAMHFVDNTDPDASTESSASSGPGWRRP